VRIPAPDVFEVREDGIARLLTGKELTEDMREDLDAAVAECPAQVLRLVEAIRAPAGPRPVDVGGNPERG
jgi:4Fe-4S single cluster domain